MNIDLIYQGTNYNFDLRKDINIKYIQDLASKLISKDSSTFNLIYKNINLSEFQNTTPIKEIAKDDNNISIIIATKEKLKMLFTEKNQTTQKLKEINQLKSANNVNNLKTMLNSPIITPINSKNKSTNLSIEIFRNKKKKKSADYISENKVFEEIYISKENEIYSLMNILSEKIKEYDDILYKNYKNNNKSYNSELSLYEKNIIDFKDKQISFLKKLLNYFNVHERDFLCGNVPLNEFYLDLKLYNNSKDFFTITNNEYKKNKTINNSYKKNNIGLVKLKEENYTRNINEFKKLPIISNNKTKNNIKIYLSENNYNNKNNNTINSEDSNENKSDYEDNKALLKGHLFNSNIKKVKNKKVNNDKKKELLSKTENKENKEKELNSKLFKNNNNNNTINTNKNNNTNNNKQYNFNKIISLSNTNDTSQSTILQSKMAKATTINTKKKETKTNLLIKNKRLNTIGNNHSMNKNKINALFEDLPNKQENTSMNNSSEISESSKESKNDLNKIDEESYIRNFGKTKHNNKLNKSKKIGNNVFDFLI